MARNNYLNNNINNYIKLPIGSMNFFSPFACMDQYIGKIDFSSQTSFLDLRVDMDYDFSKNKLRTPKLINDAIVLVLESPHKREFDVITHNPIGPANGITGINIRKDLLDSLGKLKYFASSAKTYDVILLNAVQFQCSLGEPTKLYRSNNWKSIWSKSDITNDFVNRLECINPLIVINLVTGNITNKKSLKYLSEIQILNYITSATGVIKFIGTHPSCWHYTKYAKVK